MNRTPGTWQVTQKLGLYVTVGSAGHIVASIPVRSAENDANARLIAAAPDLYEAAELLEAAELAHANCSECEGDIVGELCPACFPLFDDARLARRAALEKATGKVLWRG